jgi:hypothetical protein
MILSETQWKQQQEAYLAEVAPYVEAHLQRRSIGEKHPVHDFLFEYYGFRPSHLLRWSPGLGVWLAGTACEFLARDEMSEGAEGIGLSKERFPAKRLTAAKWILNLLETTQSRPPMFGCMGLHEWAMVYERKDVRHPQLPLRMPHDELRKFVAQQPIRCSHFDAFRFFSSSAKPLNRIQPSPDNRAGMEQPGCLHVNMDMYKWAFKFSPWISSEHVQASLRLAIKTRELDMRASPYDLETLGYEAIPIETEEGQKAYVDGQQQIYAEGQVVREGLIGAYKNLIGLTESMDLSQQLNRGL